MKKLSLRQIKQLEEHQRELESLSNNLQNPIDDFNSRMAELWDELLADPIKEYNNAVDAAQSFIEETRGKMQSYYDERSEQWQEGDAGSEYYDWIELWEEDLEHIELEQPEDLDAPDFQAAEQIKEYTEEP